MIHFLNVFTDEAFAVNDFSALGMANSNIENTLTFCDDAQYVQEINHNSCILGVITTESLALEFANKKLFTDDDPRYTFFSIYNKNADLNKVRKPSVIHPTAKIHPRAYVSDINVVIGENTIVHPNVTILEDVYIGANCVIQSGTVIGSEGFEYKRTKKGVISVLHDGRIIIHNNVQIGANTCVDKGFSYRDTVIEDDVMIDNLIHVAHSVHVKRGAFVIAGTSLGGSSEICENAWLSVNTSIAPKVKVNKNAFVSIGAVVTKDVDENQHVSGNFAVPHQKFIKFIKSILKD